MQENKAFLPNGQRPRQVDGPMTEVETTGRRSKWNPLGWPTMGKLIGVGVVAVLIVVIVVASVEGTRNSHKHSYPDYSTLNYSVTDRFEGTGFFDHFNYFHDTDPADGFVNYVSGSVANSSNLTYAGETSAILRVDNSNTDASKGRNSVRIASKNKYESGLFVFDIIHTPYGCGTWPAVWLADPSDWPGNGEIDVVEAVNQGNKGNQFALHTSKGCTMKSKRRQTGTVAGTNCWNGTDDNSGCAVQGAVSSYGEDLNGDGGALYAMELREEGIRMWVFNRASPPGDLKPGNDSSPDPSGWGIAIADFPGTDCDIPSHFKNQSIIANIDLCGSWAGSAGVYSEQFGCPGTCSDYVATNATAFDNAYWEFASFRIYSAA